MLIALFRLHTSLTLLLVTIASAHAHDIWLYADQFRLSEGDRLTLHQVSGSEMEQGMEYELMLDITPSFAIHTNDGKTDLLEGIGRTRRIISPVLDTIVEFDGPALITMQHSFIYTQFDSAEFANYLKHEALNEELGGTFTHKDTYSERYARSFKCLVQSGDGRSDVHKRLVGQPLEIILLQNPYELDPGERLEMQVFYNGTPAAHHQVTAMSRANDGSLTKIDLRTDASGKATMEIQHPGVWLLRSLYLFANTEGDTDWESHWTSFTFAVD